MHDESFHPQMPVNMNSSRNINNQTANLNSSEFLHSKLGLLDDQITINYDLSLPTIGNEEKKIKKKLSRKEKFAQRNNF